METRSKPLCVELFAGLGGFSTGAMMEGYECVGFDIERHVYGECRYPAQLILQDVRTIHGRQLRDASLIWASPPCQEFSLRAQPWKRGKAQVPDVLPEWWVKPEGVMEPAELAEWKAWKISHPLPPPDTSLFNACFRIQREACEAAGRHIPLVVENVRGAQPWVGRSAAAYGSYYLWGDVPALMPITGKFKSQGMNWSDQTKRGQDFTRIAGRQAIDEGRKAGGTWFDKDGYSPLRDGVDGQKTTAHVNQCDGHSHTRHLTNQAESDGCKIGGDWLSDSQSTCRRHSSKSNARKAASAMIARIPLNLARWIGHVWWPEDYDRPTG